jgi:hypothetical protein
MSFINAAKGTIDGAIRTASNRLAGSLFRSGTGMIGAISSINTGLITLTSLPDVVNFEVGMVLNTYDDAAGTNQSTSNAKGYVIAVNRAAGTVTVSATAGGAAGTPTNWSTSFSYICIDGDLNLKLKGLAAWVPTTAPTATTFFGVNRSKDVTRLGGVRYDGSAQPIEEALVDGSALIAREGGTPGMCFVSYATFAALEKSLGSKVQYCDLRSDAGIGFKGIKIHGANSMIDVIADRSCPAGLAYLLDMDTWALESAGDAPMIINQIDGLDMLRVYNADAAEIRVGSYAQLACNAPGWNGVIQTAV